MKKRLWVLLLPLLGWMPLHKFYVSVTHINYSEKDDAFQITSRVFIDDMENVLQERYGIKSKLATQQESATAQDFIEKYFRTKFIIRLDDKPITYTFLGSKYDNDILICYIELPKIELENLEKMEIENEILTDLFDEQKNIIHIKLFDK